MRTLTISITFMPVIKHHQADTVSPVGLHANTVTLKHADQDIIVCKSFSDTYVSLDDH